jgi:predicted DsbA family dithiol-disulfide isomerase
MARVHVENFTDPGCPFAWSAEPARRRLQWLYGEQLAWTPRMVVLSERPEDYEAKGFTVDKQAAGAAAISARYGMPIDSSRRPRMTATVHACRAVVAARVHAGTAAADALLRRLRVQHLLEARMIDEQEVIDRAAEEAGLDRDRLWGWTKEPEVEAQLRADAAAARAPLAAARALDHKLAGPASERRYTCPTLVLSAEGRATLVAPGFQPLAAYEVLLANLAPELTRRADPESVAEVLAWAREPLAAVEVAAVLAASREDVEAELALAATDDGGLWSLEPRFARADAPVQAGDRPA